MLIPLPPVGMVPGDLPGIEVVLAALHAQVDFARRQLAEEPHRLERPGFAHGKRDSGVPPSGPFLVGCVGVLDLQQEVLQAQLEHR